jgi:pSer/pThr/pTyr-binding forkhead associated (FHA) protein
VTASIAFEEALLLLKIGFLVVLYLFIWRIVRTASRDLRTPQESFVLAPDKVRKAQPAAKRQGGRLVAVGGANGVFPLDSAAITVGRGGANDIPLEDDFASTRHARVEPRSDGVWIEDIGSTNGTSVNGVPLTGPHKLLPGDVVRVGQTDLRYER